MVTWLGTVSSTSRGMSQRVSSFRARTVPWSAPSALYGVGSFSERPSESTWSLASVSFPRKLHKSLNDLGGLNGTDLVAA